MTDIAIVGATGRMGRRVIALAPEHDCRVVAAIVSEHHSLLGRDSGEIAGIGGIGVPLAADFSAMPQVLVDFSAPVATRRWLGLCAQRRIPMLIGTTGLQAADEQLINAASRQIPILAASNMSMGIALLTSLARSAAARLGADWDFEIVEAHHRGKKDAPSGTALTLANAMVSRPGEAVPTHSLRIGDEVGRHTIYLAGPGERLELTHQATSRDTFARGALRAATWLAGRSRGRYQISDVFGT